MHLYHIAHRSSLNLRCRSFDSCKICLEIAEKDVEVHRYIEAPGLFRSPYTMAPRRHSGALLSEPVAPRRNPRRCNRDRDSPIRQLIIEQIRLPRRAPKARPSYQPDIVPQSSPLSTLPTIPPPVPPPTPPQQTPDILERLIDSSPTQPSHPLFAPEPLSAEDIIEAIKAKDPRSVNHTIAQRLQALALAEAGIAIRQAAALSGLSNTKSVRRLQKKARDRGYDPTVSTIIKPEYVSDAARLGRPVEFDTKKQAEMLAAGIDIIPTF